MDLSGLFHQLLGQGQPQQPAQPQAYSRVTHTPINWGNVDGAYGQYQPASGQITLNKDTLPQTNPNMEYMHNVVRHESVHAMMPNSTTHSIMQYFQSNPAQKSQATHNLATIDPAAAASPEGLAQEAPAYLMMGRHLGLPENIAQEYMSRMPDAIRAKYMRLLTSNLPGGF